MDRGSPGRAFRLRQATPNCWTETRLAQNPKLMSPRIVLRREDVEALMHLRLSEACREVKMCQTSFKKICRLLGIPKWPYSRMRVKPNPQQGTLQSARTSYSTPMESARKPQTEPKQHQDWTNVWTTLSAGDAQGQQAPFFMMSSGAAVAADMAQQHHHHWRNSGDHAFFEAGFDTSHVPVQA